MSGKTKKDTNWNIVEVSPVNSESTILLSVEPTQGKPKKKQKRKQK